MRVRHFLEVGRPMISHIYWVFPETTSELGNVCHRSVVQCPKRIFIKRFDALFQPYLNAIGQQVVLPEEILLLDFRVERGIVFFSDGHREFRAGLLIAGPNIGFSAVLYARMRVARCL